MRRKVIWWSLTVYDAANCCVIWRFPINVHLANRSLAPNVECNHQWCQALNNWGEPEHVRLYACLLACDHMPYVAPLTELFWLLADVKLVLCVTKPNDKLVSQCAARSGSPRDDKIITLVRMSSCQKVSACSYNAVVVSYRIQVRKR